MIPVWDRFVRLFHWALVGAVTLAGVTGFLLGPTWLAWHILGGVTAAALVGARIVWGFTGTTHARFADFVTAPRATLDHLRDLRAGRAARHLGHNPLGGWMVLALAASVIALAVTGTILLGGEFKAGPLKMLAYATAHLVGEGHELFANLLLALIAAHLAGAVFESLRTRENLPRAMLTGLKERRPGDHRPTLYSARPVLAIAATSLLLGTVVAATLALMARPGPAPVAPPAAFAEECSACHMAFPPALLPAASWQALMAGLNEHFGEDASLDAATTAEITAYLTAHSAEAQDTKPANLFRRVNPDAPLAITETRAWQRIHRDIAAATFAAKPVFTRSNCAACHGDAALGAFFPPNVSIPKEALP
jgi:cytochrome b/mono/diheme cytochrome c family protein